jgi:endogenous inhibitor of DNA gyrase (YacG/DUF329 family)
MRRVDRVRVTCAVCGKEVEKYLSQIKENKTGRFFCSKECQHKGGVKPRTVPRKPCERCGNLFVAYGDRSGRFCSKACYDAWQRRRRVERICEQCGTTFDRPPAYETRQVARFCSRACEAESRIKRPLDRQHNGRPAILDKMGYVRVYEPTHVKAMKGGWVFEHRLLMERHLNRSLAQDEHVHHINGVKDDNRLENLVVLGHSEHSSLTGRERTEALTAMQAELAEYRRRFGQLED